MAQPQMEGHRAISARYREVSMSSCSEQSLWQLLFRVPADGPDLN